MGTEWNGMGGMARHVFCPFITSKTEWNRNGMGTECLFSVSAHTNII